MSEMIKEDIFSEETEDEQIAEINTRIKQLDQQIVKIIS